MLRVTWPEMTQGVVPNSKPGLTTTFVPPPPAPACETVKVCPATVSVPVREVVPTLAATE